MNRRSFVRTSLTALAAAPALPAAALPQMKITRVRYYDPGMDAGGNPRKNPLTTFNQSTNVVMVETDAGITGIGEGGSRDTIEQCASQVIGKDPLRSEHLWQLLYRGQFYPAGREKLHALGALDMAFWDIKGKALGVPVHQLLGGLSRDHVECYATGFPSQGSLKDTARACIEAGYRAFRIGAADGNPYDRFEAVEKSFQDCLEVRQGVGKNGAWAIDFHARFDMSDAIRLATQIEPLGPYFVEDLVRSENPEVYRTLRPQVKVPIAVGEQFGDRWDINRLLEEHLIDYSRAAIPNVGGITEFVKIAALCETHYVGLIPHFTGPISEAALVHACGVFSGPVLMEMLPSAAKGLPYLPQCFDFRDGRMWPNQRPGLGVEVDLKRLNLITEITEPSQPVPVFRRPDGSFTNW